MRNLKLAFRTLFKTPFVTIVADPVARARHRRQRGDLLAVQRDAARAAARAASGAAGELRRRRARAGLASCGQAGGCDEVFSYPMFRDLEKASTSRSAASRRIAIFGANIAFRGQTLNGERRCSSPARTSPCSASAGARPAAHADDDQTIGGAPVAVLSYATGKRSSAAIRASSARQIIVNGQPMTIIGVAPEGFNGTTLGSRPDVFVPITMRGVMNAGLERIRRPSELLGRICSRASSPACTIEQATASINDVYHADHQRRRSAAAEGHEREDDGGVPGEEDHSSSDGAPRPELAAQARRGRR